ncbi:MAG: ABC transporter ATP-binding protein [Tissierellia bacterium]|nr:ABC transporter ATP-binding protein [Tissierellia bacterium]
MDNYVVEMRNITKVFPGIIANDDVTLQLKKGEIHALLGENGAGKSTLMSVLFGFYQPEKGEIYVRGEKVDIKSPNIAHELGIGMVHQHFQLIDNFTVVENIILGDEPGGFLVDYDKARKEVIALSTQYGLGVDPDAKIEDISVGMQQRVEILKVLYRKADIIILDEPTAVLTPQEIEELVEIMKNFAAEGKSVILITHKLKEILAAADRVSVLRQGKYIGTVNVADTTEAEMASMMVGREVNFKVDKKPANPGEKVLEIKDLWVKDQRGLDALQGLSLYLREGEILGIAGVDGNGQQELVEAITGLVPIEKGEILLQGQSIVNERIKSRINKGIAYVPEDRQKRALIMDFRLDENIILKSYEKEPLSKGHILNQEEINKKGNSIIEEYDVRSSEGIDTIVRNMSGGNQQKAIIGREMDLKPLVMVASQPSRGLDVGAIEYVHKRLVELRDQGKAVLLVSFELDEIMNVSDRINVIYQGKITGNVIPEKTTVQELGLMMSGSKEVDLA